jgi:hypothetical protein
MTCGQIAALGSCAMPTSFDFAQDFRWNQPAAGGNASQADSNIPASTASPWSKLISDRREPMGGFEWVGYAASALVFLAFTMRGIVMVRLIALCSNFAFLIYGIGLRLFQSRRYI